MRVCSLPRGYSASGSTRPCVCGHSNAACHSGTGCHACACTLDPRETCGIEVGPVGAECAADTGSGRCGGTRSEHCLGEVGVSHMCTGDAEHHEFEPTLEHLIEPRWPHRVYPGYTTEVA